MLPTPNRAKADAARAAAQASLRPAQSAWIPSIQLAAEFGISRRTLSRWLRDNVLGFPRPRCVNRRLYFERNAIDDWKAAAVVKTAGCADRYPAQDQRTATLG
jgi:predicted DNA-binding transcriptional regulator AlpA